ncbi:MAG: hypothetical protein VXW29_16815, partial [SAR324 cluster bacterium]|nr:hypothetical protein [SAR324 cluster bacterium]
IGANPASQASDFFPSKLYRTPILNFSNHPVLLNSMFAQATRDFLRRFDQNMELKLSLFGKIYQHLPT